MLATLGTTHLCFSSGAALGGLSIRFLLTPQTMIFCSVTIDYFEVLRLLTVITNFALRIKEETPGLNLNYAYYQYQDLIDLK